MILLHRLADIVRLLGHDSIDWASVLEYSEARQMYRILVLASLAVGARILHARVSSEVFQCAYADTKAKTLANGVCDRLRSGSQVSFGVLDDIRFQLRLLERRRDQVRYWVGHATPTVADSDSLPTVPFPLHYAARPGRIVMKHIAQRLRCAAV